MPHCFGIVGHGVVGSLLSRLLRENGAEVLSYDSLLEREDTRSRMQKKIENDGSKMRSLDEVLQSSDYILSVVTPQSCRDIAEQASRVVRRNQVFADLTSTAPAVKRSIAAILGNSNVEFVEGVILSAVNGRSSPVILVGGATAGTVALVFQRYGLDAHFYSAEVGRASALKMLRSIFSKGIETALVEALVAAHRANLLDDVWKEIVATLSEPDVEKTLQNWICSHASSAERRCHEMQEVGRFLDEELCLPPILPPACAQVFARSMTLGISGAFPAKPDSFRQVIEFLAQSR